MDGIVDREIMDEIAAEQAGSDAEQREREDALSEGPEPGGAAGELPEIKAMPGGAAGELPEIKAEPGGAENEKAERAGSAEEIPAQVLGLLGVSTQQDAIERLTEIAVEQLVDDGAPESVARELVNLRCAWAARSGRGTSPQRALRAGR